MKKPSFQNNSGGYTLVELIIYIAMLIILTVVVINMIVTISHSKGRLVAAQELATSATASLDRITREVRAASGVNSSSSVLGTSPGKLILTSTDSTGASHTTEFSLSSTTLHIKQDGVDQGPLTQADVTVTNLVFYFMASSTDEAVRLDMTLSSGTSTSYKSESFHTTTLLRGTL